MHKNVDVYRPEHVGLSSSLHRLLWLQNVGVLDTRLANTADKLFKNVLDPILQDPQLCLDSTKLSQEGQAILSVRSGQKTKVLSFANISSTV